MHGAPTFASFDDDAKKFSLTGAKQKLAGHAQVNVFARIVHADPVDFHAALFDEPPGFAFRWRELPFNEQRDEFLRRALWNPPNFRFRRCLTVSEDALKIVGGLARGLFAVEAGDALLSEPHFHIHRPRSAACDF